MSFFKEIGNLLGLEWAGLSRGYSVVNYNGEAVYVEGVKTVIAITQTEIILNVPSARLNICGDNLTIFMLENDTIIVKGVILSVNTDNSFTAKRQKEIEKQRQLALVEASENEKK